MWEVYQQAGWRRLEEGEGDIVRARSERLLEVGERNLVRVWSGRRLKDGGERNLMWVRSGRRLKDGGVKNLVRMRSGIRMKDGSERTIVRVRRRRVQAGHSCRLAAPPVTPLRPGEVCSSSSSGVGQF